MYKFLTLIFVFFSWVTFAAAEPISLLNVRISNVSNLKQVHMESTLRDNVHGNGFCFITTGSFRDKLKNILPDEQISRLGTALDRARVRRFEKYDAYCGLTMGAEVRDNGLLKGRPSSRIRARVYMTSFENLKPLVVVRDASACSFVRFARSCFKTIPAKVETTENNDGTVSVSGAVTGLAGCYEFYERRGDLNKSIVITIGRVPESVSSQANSLSNNATHEDKTCNDRGFHE